MMASSSLRIQTSGFVDNWQGGKTLAECNLHMLNMEDSCDVTFRCGSRGHVIKAHRYVLISRSCVFHAMFTGPLAEKSDVNVPDIDHRVFKEFITYLYTDNATVESDSATALLYAASKYDVTGLVDMCLEFLDTNLTVENACIILEAAYCFDQKQLMEKAMTLVKDEGERSLPSPGFLALNHELVDQIVESDDLVADEHVIFTAVNSWAEAECGLQEREVTPEAKRSVLGDTLMKVRFPLMKQPFLVNEVKGTGLLTMGESLTLQEHATFPAVDVQPFNKKERRFKYTVSKSRYSLCMPSWQYLSKSHDAISFQTNRNLILTGYQLYGPTSKAEAIYTITTYFGEEDTVCSSMIQENTDYIAISSVYDVMYPEPVPIAAGKWYTLSVMIIGADSWYGSGGVTQVLCDDGVEFNFRESDHSPNGTDVSCGQIPSLIYRVL